MGENSHENKIQHVMNKFRNVPFVHNGRSLETGVDCLGLVILFYKEFGIHIPNDDGQFIDKAWYRKEPERFIQGINSLNGVEVDMDSLQALDLVYFAINYGIITHIGIMINDKEFLHTRPLVGVTKNTLQQFSWRRRFKGAVRLVP
ncbi:MAG: C40 family peptidase [Clostridiaceae bacterium]|nr:C40 family peptidase [Clostridiaceae bacterium]